MNDLTIFVSEDHIREGKKNSALSCPIALAIKGSDQEIGYTCVGREDASVEWWKASNSKLIRRGEYKLPKEAQTFVHNVDNGLPVEPFTFTMTLQPEEAEE
ncbi:hypothetical protein SEA_SIXAMA_14 [Gordonia phage Sixama]|uniref:Uncharacterized protein n=1 Tax=Gordonia phage Sixama TaxID=2653271 RepID=A0A5Q2F654_9CAUD|nr:hypothetical protein PP302_gp014 [Gordonia phage Sixama]QGF20193.1 hypothetical protein SEA_SIXAMA_14 [Gordonia phage Sixama]